MGSLPLPDSVTRRNTRSSSRARMPSTCIAWLWAGATWIGTGVRCRTYRSQFWRGRLWLCPVLPDLVAPVDGGRLRSARAEPRRAAGRVHGDQCARHLPLANRLISVEMSRPTRPRPSGRQASSGSMIGPGLGARQGQDDQPSCSRNQHVADLARAGAPSSEMGEPNATTTREVFAGLVERLTFHNAENGFCVLRVKSAGAPRSGHVDRAP